MKKLFKELIICLSEHILFLSMKIDYQNKCKIYLDEYPDQEELRIEFFKKVDKERKKSPYYQFINRFMKRS